MKLRINPESPVPLYHQIAEAIQYRIAIGELKGGATLPPLRRAAEDWDVNLHTVGRAYRELAERGLVETRGRAGTCVVDSGGTLDRPAPSEPSVRDFIARIVTEAREEHGLLVSELAGLLWNWPGEREVSVPTAYFVECSESQCLDHAQEIESRWNVRVVPWPLTREEEPPPGPIIATYFHYHDIRQLWPSRRDDIRFVAIHPDPNLRDRILPRLDLPERRALTLCEYDEPKALNAVAELAVLLPPEKFDLSPRVVTRGDDLMSEDETGGPLIFPPRVWADLPDERRAHPDAVHLRFFIDHADLDGFGKEFGWLHRRNVSAA